nr:hypothetical protein CFP56_56937 [Quercus suber]
MYSATIEKSQSSLYNIQHSIVQRMEDPPAYTPDAESVPGPPRSISDLRSLILANASVLQPYFRDVHVEVIVAKHGGRRPEPVAGSRTYTTTNSRVAITINDASSSTTPKAESSAQATAPALQTTSGPVKHRAYVAMRRNYESLDILVEGPPKPTPEEALTWLLDKTETMMADLTDFGPVPVVHKCHGCARSALIDVVKLQPCRPVSRSHLAGRVGAGEAQSMALYRMRVSRSRRACVPPLDRISNGAPKSAVRRSTPTVRGRRTCAQSRENGASLRISLGGAGRKTAELKEPFHAPSMEYSTTASLLGLYRHRHSATHVKESV